MCSKHLYNGEELQAHHRTPLEKGGTNEVENLILLHRICHQQLHKMGNTLGLLEA
ncbi:MAG: RNA-directed DNA polymerase [Candidatus Promineifilaceae bacterium]|jgi:RNA-directed DNA polymerase